MQNLGQGIRYWLKVDRAPTDLYELLGRPRLDPDQPALLIAVRQAHRELLPYQNHADPAVVRRALKLLLELGRAQETLSQPDKLLECRRRLLDGFWRQYSEAAADAPAAWTSPHLLAWLKTQAVHPDQLSDVVQDMLPPPRKK